MYLIHVCERSRALIVIILAAIRALQGAADDRDTRLRITLFVEFGVSTLVSRALDVFAV